MASTNQVTLSTAEVAKQADIHKDTLLRWLKLGYIPEPSRNRNGWRIFTNEEKEQIVEYSKGARKIVKKPSDSEDPIPKLARINWNFKDAKTNYLTHSIHPYPAKYIPQIPNALIQELSSVGDIVGDIFCGSGTTLVEALTLKRHAIGIDANPLACLITNAKTGFISEEDSLELLHLANQAKDLSNNLLMGQKDSLFPEEKFHSNHWRPDYPKLNFWFEEYVIEELAESLAWCNSLKNENSKRLALTAFSSIVVTVSKQDSDTRYVRRDKNNRPGDTFRRFAKALSQVTHSAREYSELVESRFSCTVIPKSILETPIIQKMDLMVCSPPYPNAYSYHLYHMTRMIWLQMDQPLFKQQEIGSHRKYSSKSKNRATIDTFVQEFANIFQWLSINLKKGGYACFVIGDSTIKGEKINNANLISDTAQKYGFEETGRLSREMLSTKKSFNPKIGSIKNECILVLKNK